MVVEVVRTYLEAASGLTRLTRQRAVMAARTLLREGEGRHPAPGGRAIPVPGEEETARGGVGASIQALAEELITTNDANRAALEELVVSAVDHAVRSGALVRREDHERLQRRVADLERRLAGARTAPGIPPQGADRAAEVPAAPPRPPADPEPAPPARPSQTAAEPDDEQADEPSAPDASAGSSGAADTGKAAPGGGKAAKPAASASGDKPARSAAGKSDKAAKPASGGRTRTGKTGKRSTANTSRTGKNS